MFERIRRIFSGSEREARLQEHLERLRQRMPIPVFWLFGKTQSGKTSIIKYLTGAESAEIGKGFQPCTRFSRQYQFPLPEAPLLTFLDTRGLDEPGYDPSEDLAQFNNQAHVLLVTVKALDHAQENVLTHLRTIRRAAPMRPVLLVLTCLHEAYPQQQHPLPYPFGSDGGAIATSPALPADLTRSLIEQHRRFEGLVDRIVAVDLTPVEEGFNDPDYGGVPLRQTLLELLPAAFRQTLLSLGDAGRDLQDFFARQALPYILAYSTLAGSAAALPVPVVDLVLLSGIQSQMVYHLAQLYGQPLTAQRFLEIASTLGLGLLLRQGSRMLLKYVPYIGPSLGSVMSGTLAGASTFALGKAFCYYYRAVHQGHVPKTEELRRHYREQLAQAEQAWKHKP
ncbi:MAG TPA: DUF697 domain-containing protein [Gemmataceae bacterium]|nr:DUF697 domain-containing protein [Gemmataceae bacterium]